MLNDDPTGAINKVRSSLAVELCQSPRVIDFCCGLGGLSLAASRLGMKILAGVDPNRDALKTFQRNFPDATAIADSVGSQSALNRCRKLLQRTDQSSSPVVIVSGPPCQGFSVAGPGNPKDRRNRVLLSVAEAIVELQPDCALIENVAMLLSPKNVERLNEFEQILNKGTYKVSKFLLNASDFGVAQKRKRAFFFITRNKLDEQTVEQHLNGLRVDGASAGVALKGLPKAILRPELYDDEDHVDGIANHFAMRHSSRVQEKIAKIAPGTGPMSYRKLHPDRPANTLFSGHRAPPAHFREPRSITVREAARLQGFPDDFRIFGTFGNQMIQVINAVPPPLAEPALKILIQMAKISKMR